MAKFETKESLGRLLGTVFIGIGGLITLAGLIWLVRTAVFVNQAAKVPGQIISMESSDGAKGGSVYHAVFKFNDSAGIAHTQRSSSGSSNYSFEAGETVTVLYDPTTPKKSEIDSFQTLWRSPLAFTGFGLLFGGFACFWLFMWTRQSRL
jgi:hypothetical protein